MKVFFYSLLVVTIIVENFDIYYFMKNANEKISGMNKNKN